MAKDGLPKPSICRMVLFRSTYSDEQWNGASEHPAVITRVWSSTCVNLKVLCDGAAPVDLSSVELEGSFAPIDGFPHHSWSWPGRS